MYKILTFKKTIFPSPRCAAHLGDNFVIENLGEFENTSACFSVAQMSPNHEKTGGRKSCGTLPLKQTEFFLNPN